MRTRQRLLALKKWTYETVCKGRTMKCPGEGMDITDLKRQEPQVFLGWQPARPDETGVLQIDPLNVCPGILISPTVGNVKYIESKRFDRYNDIHRTKAMGQWLNVSVMFSVYEPGTRLPGFIDAAENEGMLDLTKLVDGTEEGLFTLYGWMDDFKDALIATQTIPGSDLFLDDIQMTYGPLMDQNYIVDKRPIYYGFINANFCCYADNVASKTEINYLL